MTQPLQNKRIAVPESRELDLFARMLEERGALCYRAPLVSIHDSPDVDAVLAWIDGFVEHTPDYLILLTGEGLRRLLGFAERHNRTSAFVQALANTQTITRGPKPGRALRSIDLKPTLLAAEPTSSGVIQTLATLNLRDKRVAVQLYGDEPNLPLIQAIEDAGGQSIPVSPYRYASDVETSAVSALIEKLIEQDIDAIAFTSMQQVKRLFSVAKSTDQTETLTHALNHTVVASVGPVVTEELERFGVQVKLMPESSFFMKPLTRELVNYFGTES